MSNVQVAEVKAAIAAAGHPVRGVPGRDGRAA